MAGIVRTCGRCRPALLLGLGLSTILVYRLLVTVGLTSQAPPVTIVGLSPGRHVDGINFNDTNGHPGRQQPGNAKVTNENRNSSRAGNASKENSIRSHEKPDANLEDFNTGENWYLSNNPALCAKSAPVLIVVLVHSEPQSAARRKSIRDTWANKFAFREISVQLVFLVGTTQNKEDIDQLRREKNTNGDIVQGRFEDSRRHLVEKGVMGFRWISEFCYNADMVIKLDDDMFINVYEIMERIFPVYKSKLKHILCAVNNASLAAPNEQSQLPKSNGMIPGASSFRFCEGAVVIFTPDVITNLYEASVGIKLGEVTWDEDTFLYGILPQAIKDVTFVSLNSNITTDERACLQEYQSLRPVRLLACRATDADFMYRMWRNGLRRVPKNNMDMFAVNFRAIVYNFIRNFPKLADINFHQSNLRTK